MDRREAIKRTAVLMGGFAFAPSALGLLNGCTSRSGVDWKPQFFNTSQAKLISVLSDTIIPSGDTPGAVDVGVPSFIEEMVSKIYDADARQTFVTGLEAFNSMAKERKGKDFADLDPDAQYSFAHDQNKLAIGGKSEDDPGTRFFLIMKELTLLGYFTSEAGATQTLRYVAVPGRYEGCVPFEDIGKTWAT